MTVQLLTVRQFIIEYEKPCHLFPAGRWHLYFPDGERRSYASVDGATTAMRYQIKKMGDQQ